jgi:phospholipid transport system substrate-binding protein
MRRLTTILILMALPLLSAEALPAAPNEVIQEAVDLLEQGLDAHRDELAKDPKALYAFIDGILLPRFERRFAAISVLGSHWRTATEEQRNRFIEAFYTTLLHRYAEGILEFDTDRIEILPYRGNPNSKIATVKTSVQLDDGTKVPVHYELIKSKDDGEWRMFNVKIEGVSYVVNYRSEFDTEIRNSSLEQVIERLEKEAGLDIHE